MRTLTAGLLLALCTASCADTTPFTKPGVTQKQKDDDHHHCLSLMQAERQGRRSAPNWHTYDNCMKQLGYTKPAK